MRTSDGACRYFGGRCLGVVCKAPDRSVCSGRLSGACCRRSSFAMVGLFLYSVWLDGDRKRSDARIWKGDHTHGRFLAWCLRASDLMDQHALPCLSDPRDRLPFLSHMLGGDGPGARRVLHGYLQASRRESYHWRGGRNLSFDKHISVLLFCKKGLTFSPKAL